MLRKLLIPALSFLCWSRSVHADEVMEPYAPAPAVAVPAPPPAPPQPVPQYDYSQYPPPDPRPPVPPPPPPRYQYYPAPTYYVQPAYAPQPPARFYTVEQPRYGLMVAGLVVLGASWSINALTAYMIDDYRLAIPVVGPLLFAHNVNTSNDDFGGRTAVTFLVLDALVETTGAVMFLAGALTHHHVRIMERAGITVVPTAGVASLGLAAFGRF